MFAPRLALSSLSGRSDAAWALGGLPHAGAAILGGISLDSPTRRAASELVGRDRREFLPADPVAFVTDQLERLEDEPIRAGVNVRSTTSDPVVAVAECCRETGAFLEVNAHCRQQEMCSVGAGETLLRRVDDLERLVSAAAATGVPVGAKVRAEVEGVDLVAVGQALERAGASFVHVDAMDSPEVVNAVAEATDLFVVANNGVRDATTVDTYLRLGADAVSVGRPSDDPRVLERVGHALTAAEGVP